MTDTATVEPGTSGLLDNVQASDESQPINPQSVEIDHKAADPSAPAPEDPLERHISPFDLLFKDFFRSELNFQPAIEAKIPHPIDNSVSESTYDPVESYIYDQIKDKVNNSIRLVRISKL